MGGEEKYGGIVKEVHHTCDVRPTMAGAPYMHAWWALG